MSNRTKKGIIGFLLAVVAAVTIANGIYTLKDNIDSHKKTTDEKPAQEQVDPSLGA